MTPGQKIVCPDCGAENIPGVDNCESCQSSLETLSLPQADTDLLRRILEGTISDLKPRDPIFAGPKTPVSEIVRVMREKNQGCALIVDAKGGLAGLITERDLAFAVAGLRDPAKTPAAEVMRANPPCLAHDEPVSHAFHHMAVGNDRHLPIKSPDGKLKMISSRDLLRHLTV